MDSKFSFLLNLMILIQFPVTIICFIIGLWKLIEFNMYNIQLKNLNLEFAYFLLGFLNIVFSGRVCYSMVKKRSLQSYILGISCFSLCWIIFAGIYTIISYKELIGIPFMCPSNFPYKYPVLLHICKINTINLISLWILGICSLLTMICACCFVRQILKSVIIDEKGENNGQENERKIFTEP
ncbi:hypothetical protein GLOIN_2v621761 [Rhizophagus irregularis DAOM 181602=DAOM 197198]|uniref:Transmembrane protein n=2 Tax=Rhizophagus irregularis TaxID=588596 RepID=A0A2P4QZ28_RHIID|nr:hypothetical protein GLOIN_2v621761 [Rhizophagus irregularis DAOM 181602=DAOM 197198]POG82899.1 hypothetical protein GLOIN_2v621761 [Rhizophagus irregularis DAOM 181602=DAOM 197198]|eukprot:XP_025189765.1 hypothetical protein GLOIN_2v621761 [Rhizophagus irregularis DAOM 181602=DAOM 197198]